MYRIHPAKMVKNARVLNAHLGVVNMIMYWRIAPPHTSKKGLHNNNTFLKSVRGVYSKHSTLESLYVENVMTGNNEIVFIPELQCQNATIACKHKT
jgi:hypothetical protein